MEFKEKGKYDEEKWIWSEITNFFCINSSNIIFKKDTATHKYSQLKSETIRRAKFIINKKINYQSFSFFDFYLLEYHYHHHQHQYQHTPISGILKVGGKYTVFLCFIITWYLVNNIEREKKSSYTFFYIIIMSFINSIHPTHNLLWDGVVDVGVGGKPVSWVLHLFRANRASRRLCVLRVMISSKR